MKEEIYVSVCWGDEFGKPPKTPEERARDEALAIELLERAKAIKGVKVLEFRKPIPQIPGHETVEREKTSPSYLLQAWGQLALEALLELYQPAAHLITGFRVWKNYTTQELESAPLLRWRLTNQAIEDDYYTLHFDKGQSKGIAPYTRNCEVCGAPLEQVRDMWVPVAKMGKRDLSLTYGFEVILSARLAQMLQESGLTGFTLRPVWSYRKPYQGEPRLFQLVVTNTLPPMASPPTEFEEEWPRPKQCDVCGRRAYYLKHTHYWGRIQYYEDTNVYYPKDVLGVVQDFNIAAERFGELRGSHQLIIITQRVYRWLREQKVKGWSAEPVYLVE